MYKVEGLNCDGQKINHSRRSHGRMGVWVKEELCDKVVEVRRVNDSDIPYHSFL